MSYNKKTWANGDLITKEGMNNIEDGIYDAHDKINVINNKVEENTANTNTARQDISDIKLQIGTEELTTTSKEIKGAINGLNSQIKQKVSKGEGGVITPVMLSQEVKEQMTGGSVAVVGENAILEPNIVDGQVTSRKLNIIDKNINDVIVKVDNLKFDVVSGTKKIVEDNTCFLLFIPVMSISVCLKFNYPRRSTKLYVCDNIITKPTNMDNMYSEPYTNLYGMQHSKIKDLQSDISNENKYICIEFDKTTAPIDALKCLDIEFHSEKSYGTININNMPEKYKDDTFVYNDLNFIDHNSWVEGLSEYGNEIIGKEGYFISNLFSIETNQKYYLSTYGDTGDLMILLFDKNRKIVNRTYYDLTLYSKKKGIIITDESIKYGAIRLSKSLWETNKDTICFSKEDLSLYKNPIGDNVKVNPNKLTGIYENTIVLPQNTSYYYRDKNLCVLGDSLSQNGSGQGVAVAKSCGFAKYYNCGIGGSAVEVSNQVDHESTTINSMCTNKRINELPQDMDYLIIMAGTNGNASLGELSIDNTDATTFIGAYNIMLSKIYYRYKVSNGYYSNIDYSGVEQIEDARDVQIVLVTPPQAYSNASGIEYPHGKLFSRGQAIIDMSRVWGLPCLDSMRVMQMNVFNRYLSLNDSDMTHYNQRSQKTLSNALVGLFRMIEPIDYGLLNRTSNHLNK